MILFNIIYPTIVTIVLTAAFIIIFKDMLRFNIYISTAIIAIVFAVDELVYMPFSPGYDSNIIITITYILMILTCILLVRPDKIIDMLIIDCFFHFLYNIIGTALMALSAAVYGAITGADPDTWFTTSTSTASDEIIRYVAVVVAAAVATIIVLKCMHIILNLNLRLKLPLFLGTAVPMYTFMILKNLLVYDSSQLLSGTFVVCYGLLLTIIAISLFVFFINVFLKTKGDNQLAQLQIEAQNAHYQKILNLQQELRETKHDLVNQLVAYRLSQSSSPDNDGN